MMGYFDPDTLVVTDRQAMINFISATNADDVRTVHVRTSRDARRLVHNLRCQRDRGITSCIGEAMVVSGQLTLNEGHDDEGVILVDGDESRILPVKLDFDASGDQHMPRRSLFSAFGYMQDGALIVQRAAVYELSQIPNNTSEPAQLN